MIIYQSNNFYPLLYFFYKIENGPVYLPKKKYLYKNQNNCCIIMLNSNTAK